MKPNYVAWIRDVMRRAVGEEAYPELVARVGYVLNTAEVDKAPWKPQTVIFDGEAVEVTWTRCLTVRVGPTNHESNIETYEPGCYRSLTPHNLRDAMTETLSPVRNRFAKSWDHGPDGKLKLA